MKECNFFLKTRAYIEVGVLEKHMAKIDELDGGLGVTGCRMCHRRCSVNIIGYIAIMNCIFFRRCSVLDCDLRLVGIVAVFVIPNALSYL